MDEGIVQFISFYNNVSFCKSQLELQTCRSHATHSLEDTGAELFSIIKKKKNAGAELSLSLHWLLLRRHKI
uniref:Uncharacterized protein n=1 Tax=Nelumbo nucifera TaxID=4432 RepID=A0A822YA54_NELNU|nr:TPA_asm: hypothetical protein HUJ06_030441 [Nelumbo nucifera]